MSDNVTPISRPRPPATNIDALDDARDGIRQARAVIELARSACVDHDGDQYDMLGGVVRILESVDENMVKAGAST